MNDPKPSRPARGPLSALEQSDAFIARHVGTSADDQAAMLAALAYPSRAALMDAVVPASIRRTAPLDLSGSRHRNRRARAAEERSPRRTGC